VAIKYLEASNYDTYSELKRRVDAVFAYPNKTTKTQRYCLRETHADGRALLTILDGFYDTIETVLTAPEIAAVTDAKPAGFSVNPESNNPSPINIEIPYASVNCVVMDGDSITAGANNPWDLPEADRLYTRVANVLTTTWDVRKVAVGGHTMQTILSDVNSCSDYPKTAFHHFFHRISIN